MHKLFILKKSASKNNHRNELTALLKAVSSEDTTMVYKLDRISKFTKHLIELTEYFEQNNIQFISLQDHIDTEYSMGRIFFRVMASISELERDIIVERTQVRYAAARIRGRLDVRNLTPEDKLTDAVGLYHSNAGYTLREIIEKIGVSKSVFYRHLVKSDN